MANPSDSFLRGLLGPSLQTAALRCVVLLGAFAFLGALVAYFVR
jgi:hypothetical protein